MPQNELPAEVERLLRERIHSIETLEILLLLRGDSQRPWSSAEVNRVVRSSEPSVAKTLDALARQDLLLRIDGTVPSYRFAPRDEPLIQAITALASLYQERRVRIVQAIYSDRNSEVDEFAKAFKLRKDNHA